MSAKTIVITGALSGIGEECSYQFAYEKYNLIFSGLDIKQGEALQTKLRKVHPQCHFIMADVTDEKQVINLIKFTIKIYGRVDVVINSAGTEGHPSTHENTTVDDFHHVFNTNVLGTQLVMKHALPIMCKQCFGSLINISSRAGQAGVSGGGIYAASKHAVNGLTRSAALEVAAKGVRVNAIAPGPVDTDLFDRFVGHDKVKKAAFLNRMPSGEIITTKEIAGIALFLASDTARSIIGQIITVDGGYSVGI